MTPSCTLNFTMPVTPTGGFFLVALTHAFCYGRPSGETAEHAIMRFNEYGIRTDVVKAERFLDELDLRGEEFIANLLVEIFADDHKQHVSFMYWYVAKNGLVKVTGMRDKDNVMLFGQSRYDGGLEWQEAEVQWQKMAGEYERFFGLPPTDSAAKSLERKINRSRRIRITNATDEKYWGSRTHLHFGFDMVHDMKTGRYEAIAPHHGYFTRHVRHLKKPADEKCWKMLQATTEIPEAVYRAIRIVVAEMPESGAGLADGQAKKNKEWNDRVVRVFIEKMALMFAGSRRYDAAGYEQLTYLFGPSGTGKSTVMELVEGLGRHAAQGEHGHVQIGEEQGPICHGADPEQDAGNV